MKTYRTSFTGLFEPISTETPAVERIEIPLIQRDYAQGRTGVDVGEIRRSFLKVLHRAVTSDQPTGLDFIYGEVDGGTLRPLDGQQRLTTLFLLHWYIAGRADQLTADGRWKQFSYATRPSARLFCEHLVNTTLPDDKGQCAAPDDLPSTWIRDQSWYLHVWRHDPTISSMLVMIDAIHQQFAGTDFNTAWQRLIDPAHPAIWFHRLLIEDMGSAEDLYIKMNSRGKPLTRFETFKARLESTIQDPERASSFAHKVDGKWSDVMWPFRGSDDIVDDEFMAYLAYVCELCEWSSGATSTDDVETKGERLFGGADRDTEANLEVLFQAFETWVGTSIDSYFEALFTLSSVPGTGHPDRHLRLFGADTRTNLFEVCCHAYGTIAFGWSQRLLLYAVLLHRRHDTEEFPRRLRIVRNLIEASSNELRVERMPGLIQDVSRIVNDGTLDNVTSFNQAQVDDERAKGRLLQAMPALESELFRLEDHPLLRGSLVAFDVDPAALDAEGFHARVDAFYAVYGDPELRPSLAAALLSVGDYQRERGDARSFQFGSSQSADKPWRDLLTGAARPKMKSTGDALQRLLDDVAQSQDPAEALREIRTRWLVDRESNEFLDWRYYMVRYEAMREGGSGIYFGVDGRLGYSICMLRTDRTRVTSNYRDPFLLTIYRESGLEDRIIDPWFTGWEADPRWMLLKATEAGIRVVDRGFEVTASSEHIDKVRTALSTWDRVQENEGMFLVGVPQERHGVLVVDTEDRIKIGVKLVSALLAAGL